MRTVFLALLAAAVYGVLVDQPQTLVQPVDDVATPSPPRLAHYLSNDLSPHPVNFGQNEQDVGEGEDQGNGTTSPVTTSPATTSPAKDTIPEEDSVDDTPADDSTVGDSSEPDGFFENKTSLALTILAVILGVLIDMAIVFAVWYHYNNNCLTIKPVINAAAYASAGTHSKAITEFGDFSTGLFDCFTRPADVFHVFMGCGILLFLDILASTEVIAKDTVGVIYWVNHCCFQCVMPPLVCFMPCMASRVRAALGGSSRLSCVDVSKMIFCAECFLCQIRRAIDDEFGVITGLCFDLQPVGDPMSVGSRMGHGPSV